MLRHAGADEYAIETGDSVVKVSCRTRELPPNLAASAVAVLQPLRQDPLPNDCHRPWVSLSVLKRPCREVDHPPRRILGRTLRNVLRVDERPEDIGITRVTEDEVCCFALGRKKPDRERSSPEMRAPRSPLSRSGEPTTRLAGLSAGPILVTSEPSSSRAPDQPRSLMPQT